MIERFFALICCLALLSSDTHAQVEDARVESPEETVSEETEDMSAEIARARLKLAMDHATPMNERIQMLAEIIARCDEQSIRSVASYNIGLTYLRQLPESPASMKDAIDWFQQADTNGTRAELRARARDAIGHAWYMHAHAQETAPDAIVNPSGLNGMKDMLEEKLDGLTLSARAFRSTHDVDSTYTPATENLERVRREIKQLRDQIQALEYLIEQQQQQEQQRQQQQQESAKRLEELAEQQQQESEQNAAQPPQTPEEQKQQEEDQDELCNQTQSEQEGLNQQQEQSDEMQEVQEQLQKARDAQERAQEALEQGNPDKAAEAQQEAADALQQAAEKLREMSQPNESDGTSDDSEQQQAESNQDQSEQPTQGQEGEEPSEKIDEIAQQLLEKERRERETRNARRTARPVPVERDW